MSPYSSVDCCSALKADPAYGKAMQRRGMVFLVLENFKVTTNVPVVENRVKRYPGDSPSDVILCASVFSVGECYYALGGADNLPKAISDFEAALEFQSEEAAIKQLQIKIKNAKVALKNVNKKDLYKVAVLSFIPTSNF